MKNPKEVAKGKKNRASGAEFERRVRRDLESKGWIVDKWSNNLEPQKIQAHFLDTIYKLIPAKHKFRGPGIPMVIGTGFPDFIAMINIPTYSYYKFDDQLLKVKFSDEYMQPHDSKIVIGVEVKSNGILTKLEKDKCKWLLDNKIFSKILIAEKTKVKNRVVIVYHNFEEKYGR